MEDFESVYKELNTAQKRAVDAIEGPVLVIAGPGTGKTQLLSARVAQILRRTDTSPQNILCLTFTESGAQNMRERLTRFIGKDAYDVQIGTYHAFGGDLIRQYPEYFTDTRLERPVDTLGTRQILMQIVDCLSYRSPLKQTRHHIGDLIATVSEVKRGLLSPKDLREIAASNMAIIEQSSIFVGETLSAHTKRLPTKLDTAEPLFGSICKSLTDIAQKTSEHPRFKSLAYLAAQELEQALLDAREVGKTKPLTEWKNKWLAKNADNRFILDGMLAAARMAELANVLEAYEQALADRGLYDFDDMILRSIKALEDNNELKYTLQERYQYVLLDEFQDTNAAQLRLVQLLTDNPVNEGRPNILAVGDDDQAIYAFQGAQYSNMYDFSKLYRDVLVINLSENYRSTTEILETAKKISGQITDNLSSSFPDLGKTLVAANKELPPCVILRTEYTSEVAERAGVAAQIRQLIRGGVSPSEIAVLAPKHRYLEPLVPYLDDIPVRYERRENILDAPVIRELITMSRLILALHGRNFALADSYWPEVLSYPFWNFPVSRIWELSWSATDTRKTWSELLLADKTFRAPALLFLTLATQVETETLEVILDRLIGTEEVITNEPDIPEVRSPLRTFIERQEDTLYQTVTELTVLRSRLSEHQLQRGTALGLPDLLQFVSEYEDAEQQMLNTSPYSEAADAVQLMTVFKAKGLEFSHVFLLCCQDDVWGEGSRGNGNKLTLPANLAPIRHAGATEDERLRIFFVAITRAKYGLYLSSHAATFAGKRPPRLKYLSEIEQTDGSVISQVLPSKHASLIMDMSDSVPLEAIEANWQTRHTALSPTLRELLEQRLDRYALSPTHLTSFLDLEHAGPRSFLLSTLLRFPSAPTVDLAFGNAMHETMQWLQIELNQNGILPTTAHAKEYFATRLERQALTAEQLALQQLRANEALDGFMAQYSSRFTAGNRPEYGFKREGVVLGDICLNGKIDLLEIDESTKTITVVDYKTGVLGNNKAKQHRYELQLYCYKLLIQGSHTFRDYAVNEGRLVFIEPGEDGKVHEHRIAFSDTELERVKGLIRAMWQHVMTLDLPDMHEYGKTAADMKRFESDLLSSLEANEPAMNR